MQRKIHVILLNALLILGFAAACTPASSPLPSTSLPQPTPTREPTRTATPRPAHPTGTPLPTSSPTPFPTSTRTPNTSATRAIESTQAAEALQRQVDSVLEAYGYAFWQGALGWSSAGPIHIQVSDFGALRYEPVAGERVFDDFILHVDAAGESSGGPAGCGVIIRSAPDLLNGEQYVFRTLPGTDTPGWTVERWDEGDLQFTLRSEPAPELLDDGSANTFVLIAEGATLTVYGNGRRLSGLTINRRQSGRIAFLAWQESGIASCQYENAWIWEFEK